MSRELSSRPPRVLFWCAAAVVGLIQVWAHRHNINPDSISYIEIAQSAREDGWKSYVNEYWSPLYPFLLTNAFRIFDPGALWESTVVIFANLAIYLADLACFVVLQGVDSAAGRF